jgi:hypothetical protein
VYVSSARGLLQCMHHHHHYRNPIEISQRRCIQEVLRKIFPASIPLTSDEPQLFDLMVAMMAKFL